MATMAAMPAKIMPQLEIPGTCASAGLASGSLLEIVPRQVSRCAHASPEEEAGALRNAMDRAGEQLQALMAASPADAAEIVEFQLAFLLDDELSSPAFSAIDEGVAAHEAWNAALEAEIGGYRDSGDAYFRARASDLEDLRARVLTCLSGEESDAYPGGSVIFAADLPPSRFLAVDWKKGGAVVLSEGSPNSHLAMLARARGVPMLIGAQWPSPLPAGAEVLVDAEAGRVIVSPAGATRDDFLRRLAGARTASAVARQAEKLPAVSRNGVRVQVNINIAGPHELDDLDPALCDGIGLVRTEFLFEGSSGLPDEDAQYVAYAKIVAWAAGRPVVIRTLDAGADKPLAGLTVAGESNPFLGVRGIRLSLARPEIFRIQLRALLRAAALGAVQVMLPMVTVPDEVATVSAMLDEELAALQARGIPARRPPLGIMVEVPATAICIDRFPADFCSVGSNDLTQYVAAAARDNRSLAHLLDPAQEAVLRLLRNVVEHGCRTHRSVSLCGEAGSDPKALPLLLERGLRSLSVALSAVGRVKALIATLDLADEMHEERQEQCG